MELRSSHTTKSNGEDRSKTNVKAVSGSDSGTSSGARNRKSGSSTSSRTSSSGRRASPTKHQIPSKPSCSNNEHCSKNNTAVAQRDNATLHDGTNGQVMSDPGPGNGPPASSASSAHSRQRDVLLYDFFFCVLLCKLLMMHCPML